ncbi:hypothetical protein [Pseudomonas sp. TWI628]|uniref:hypothetical protein n=1 Tax=Pseudomonas sp. TWI628 TaxID=3136788 RepID=UPI003208D6FA
MKIKTESVQIDAVGECDNISDPDKKRECLEQKTNELVKPSAGKASAQTNAQ